MGLSIATLANNLTNSAVDAAAKAASNAVTSSKLLSVTKEDIYNLVGANGKTVMEGAQIDVVSSFLTGKVTSPLNVVENSSGFKSAANAASAATGAFFAVKSAVTEEQFQQFASSLISAVTQIANQKIQNYVATYLSEIVKIPSFNEISSYVKNIVSNHILKSSYLTDITKVIDYANNTDVTALANSAVNAVLTAENDGTNSNDTGITTDKDGNTTYNYTKIYENAKTDPETLVKMAEAAGMDSTKLEELKTKIKNNEYPVTLTINTSRGKKEITINSKQDFINLAKNDVVFQNAEDEVLTKEKTDAADYAANAYKRLIGEDSQLAKDIEAEDKAQQTNAALNELYSKEREIAAFNYESIKQFTDNAKTNKTYPVALTLIQDGKFVQIVFNDANSIKNFKISDLQTKTSNSASSPITTDNSSDKKQVKNSKEAKNAKGTVRLTEEEMIALAKPLDISKLKDLKPPTLNTTDALSTSELYYDNLRFAQANGIKVDDTTTYNDIYNQIKKSDAYKNVQLSIDGSATVATKNSTTDSEYSAIANKILQEYKKCQQEKNKKEQEAKGTTQVAPVTTATPVTESDAKQNKETTTSSSSSATTGTSSSTTYENNVQSVTRTPRVIAERSMAASKKAHEDKTETAASEQQKKTKKNIVQQFSSFVSKMNTYVNKINDFMTTQGAEVQKIVEYVSNGVSYGPDWVTNQVNIQVNNILELAFKYLDGIATEIIKWKQNAVESIEWGIAQEICNQFDSLMSKATKYLKGETKRMSAVAKAKAAGAVMLAQCAIENVTGTHISLNQSTFSTLKNYYETFSQAQGLMNLLNGVKDQAAKAVKLKIQNELSKKNNTGSSTTGDATQTANGNANTLIPGTVVNSLTDTDLDEIVTKDIENELNQFGYIDTYIDGTLTRVYSYDYAQEHGIKNAGSVYEQLHPEKKSDKKSKDKDKDKQSNSDKVGTVNKSGKKSQSDSKTTAKAAEAETKAINANVDKFLSGSEAANVKATNQAISPERKTKNTAESVMGDINKADADLSNNTTLSRIANDLGISTTNVQVVQYGNAKTQSNTNKLTGTSSGKPKNSNTKKK